MKTQILLAFLTAVSVLEGLAQTVDSVITNRLAEPYAVTGHE